jgi:hypothetical protein
LNKSEASGHPCLIPDFRVNSLARGLSYIAFYMLGYDPPFFCFMQIY